MDYLGKLPWVKMHEFLLDSGNIREPREFCIQIVKKIYSLIPYDQARIYFINDNKKIYDEVLFGVDKRWSKAYLEYYSKIENGRYSILSKVDNYFADFNFSNGVHDWIDSERDEFVNDYIRPQGIHYSLGFGLHSNDNFMKSAFTLDRTDNRGYTYEEVNIMEIMQAHLDNLHKNLFVLTVTDSNYINNSKNQTPLSKREREIIELLCNGITTMNISKKLYISLSTVYRHIANIYTKLNVSNRQELILKFIHKNIE